MLDYQLAARLTEDREEGHRRYSMYLYRQDPADALAAWEAFVPLLCRYVRQRSWRRRDLFLGDELLAGLAWELFDRLSRRRIPLLREADDAADYLWRACDRWFADTVEQLMCGTESVPTTYIPERSWEGTTSAIETKLFLEELPAVARAHILKKARGRIGIRDHIPAVEVILNRILAGDRLRLGEIAKLCGKLRPSFVRDWVVVVLRMFVLPMLAPYRGSHHAIPLSHLFESGYLSDADE